MAGIAQPQRRLNSSRLAGRVFGMTRALPGWMARARRALDPLLTASLVPSYGTGRKWAARRRWPIRLSVLCQPPELVEASTARASRVILGAGLVSPALGEHSL